MDFSLIKRDICKISKTELFNLASLYRVKVPLDVDDITQGQLRKDLALVKKILKAADEDPELKLVLEKLFNKDELSDQDKEKYPLLAEYQAILDHFYETPSLEGATASSVNINSYDNDPIINHEKLLSQRKEFKPHNPLLSDDVPLEDKNTCPFSFSPTSAGSLGLTNIFSPSKQSQPLPLPPLEHKPETLPEKQPTMENIPLVKAGTFGALGSENAEEFLTRYNVASKCNRWSDDTKINLFQTHLTSTPYKWFSMYKLENPGFKWDDLESDFLKTFSPIAQIEDLQSILENRLQTKSETALQFVYEITHLCRRIDPYMSDEKIINYVLQGINPDFCTQLLSLQNANLNQLRENIYKIEKRSLLKNKNLLKHSVTHNSTTPVPSNSNGLKSLRFDEDTLNSHALATKVQHLEETIAALTVNSPSTDRKSRRDYADSGDSGLLRRKFSKSPNSSLDRKHDRRQSRSPSTSHDKHQHFRSPHRDNFDRRNATYCHICKMSNHSTDNCSFNAKTRPNSDRIPARNTMWCEFCKTKTHTYDRCYRKPQSNSRTTNPQPYKNYTCYETQKNNPSSYNFPVYHGSHRNNPPPFQNPAFHDPYANKRRPYGFPKNV